MPEPWTLDWLFSEAGAGWTFGIVSLLASLVGFLWMLRSRARPAQVVCRKVSQVSLVRIRSSARERIAVTFDGKSVDELAQVLIEISNAGSEIIRDVDLTIGFAEHTKILDYSYEADPENLEVGFEPIGENRVRVLIPFLNPVRKHSHKVTTAIVCDGNIEEVSFVGGGPGWSVKSVPLLSDEERRGKRRAALAVQLLTLVLYFAYFFWLIARWGVKPLGEPRAPGFRPVWAYGPVLAGALLWVGIDAWARSDTTWPLGRRRSQTNV